MFDSCISHLVRYYERHTPSELLRLGITNIMHRLALGGQLQNAFVVPAAQDDFRMVTVDRGATPMITWSTNFSRMSLSLWGDIGAPYDGLKYAETEPFDNTNAYELQYPWDSLYSLPGSPSSSWHLSIKDESGSGEVFNSTYFIIKDGEKSYPEQELRKRETDTNAFTNPPPTDLNDPIAKDYSLNPNYAEGSSFSITWSTNLTNYALAYWQDLPSCNPICSNGPTYLQDDFTADSKQSFAWTVTPEPYNIADSKVFWFALYKNVSGEFTDATPPIHAHYFNITTATSTSAASTTSPTVVADLPTSSTTGTSSSSTTTSSTSSSQSSSSSSSQASNTPTSTSSQSNSSPLSTSSASFASPSTKSTTSSISTGAKIGIAVGSIALIAFLVSAGYILYRYGQRKGKNAPLTNPDPHTNLFTDAPSKSPFNSNGNSISGEFFAPAGRGNPNSQYSRSDMSAYSGGSLPRQGTLRGELEGTGSGRYELAPRGGGEKGSVYELPGRI